MANQDQPSKENRNWWTTIGVPAAWLTTGMALGFALAGVFVARAEKEIQELIELENKNGEYREAAEGLLESYRQKHAEHARFRRALAKELLQFREQYGNEFKSRISRGTLQQWSE